MKATSFYTALFTAGSWLTGAAAGSLIPREDHYASMEDADPKVGTSLDTMYTDSLETCISLSAFGKTGPLSNRKVMVHIQATKQQDKTNKFIGTVSSTGYEQGGLRITVTGPSEDYVEKKMEMDEDFRAAVEGMPGGADGMKGALEGLINDARSKATEAVKNAGGSDDDVVFVRLASPDNDDIDDDVRGKVEMGRDGKIKVEGQELEDDGELDD